MTPFYSRSDGPTMEVLLLLLDEIDDAFAILRHRLGVVFPFLNHAAD